MAQPWVKLVLELLEKEPELRHPTAASVRAALSQLPATLDAGASARSNVYSAAHGGAA